MVVAEFTFIDVFWSMLVFFLWVAWFMLLFRVITDVFRRHDIGGFAKVLWIVFVIVLPFLGVFVYLVAHSRDIADRDARQAEAAQQQFDDYVQSVASTGGAAAEIEKAKQLLDSGAITQAEFEGIKAKALA